MTPDLFTALFTFALVTAGTPGPNNLMLMASGANFGFRRTLPHMLGIGLGLTTMLLLVGAGMHIAQPVGLALATDLTREDQPANVVGLMDVSLLLGAITLYAASRDLAAVIWVAGVYVLVSCISTTSWTVLGQQMRRLLTHPARLRAFNMLMAVLLMATLIPVLWPAL